MKTKLFCLALTFLLISSFEADAEQVNLRATIQVATTDPFMGRSLLRFKELIDKQNDKMISVEIFEKGKLYIDDEVVDAVASGAIEMGVAGLYQFSKKFPRLTSWNSRSCSISTPSSALPSAQTARYAR